MHILKVAMVVATGLGVTWAAQQWPTAHVASVPDDLVLAQADEAAPSSVGESPPESEGPASAVEDLSEAEIEAELRRVEEALGDDETLKEFVPTKPLAADIPIEFPSDI